MRIGFDIDGVLANFVKAYQNLTIELSGKNLFTADDINNPPCWDWPQYRGYTEDDMAAVWHAIKRDDTFWLNLEEHSNNINALKAVLQDIERRHEVYYVTSRSGVNVRRQTKLWLIDHLNYIGRCHTEPTVLISSEKGEIAHALKLDVYVDDNFDNVVDVVKKSPQTATYLLNRSYNLALDPLYPVVAGNNYTRVDTVGQMFDAEIASGRL